MILDEDLSVPSEVLEEVAGAITKSGNITTNVSTRFGSDGVRSRSCTKAIFSRLKKHFGGTTSEGRFSYILLIPSTSLLEFISAQKQ